MEWICEAESVPSGQQIRKALCEWSTLSVLPVNTLSLKYNFLFELFSKETQGSELSPLAQNQLKYETRTWRVAIIPEIVAAVLKVNEHQLLFVRSLATLQQQDVSCKTSKHSFFKWPQNEKTNKISAYRGQLFRFRFKLLRLLDIYYVTLFYLCNYLLDSRCGRRRQGTV